jgi:23S rRNA pseudouridine1911/1915/1917 synthase
MTINDILLEDGPVLVVAKPAGVATQAPPGIDSLETRIKTFLKEREAKPGNVYLGVPHRLDRPVSGAMVFAKHVRAARWLSRQFEARTVRKIYWAAVAGQVEPAEGVWTDYLWKVYGQPRSQVVDAEHPGAQSAVLRYRTLGRHAHGCLLEIELETGRTHQVRVQAASRGHAVLGDELYGSPIPFGPQHDDWRLRAIALHARELAFEHPMTRVRLSVQSPLDASWDAIIADL